MLLVKALHLLGNHFKVILDCKMTRLQAVHLCLLYLKDLPLAPPARARLVRSYHRDLRRLSRMRAPLDLIIDRLAN